MVQARQRMYRELILQSAERVFARDGYHAARMQDIAAEAGISLDSGPGAARAAVAQLDASTLADRGVIIAGDPESCIKTIKTYEDIGVDQVMLIMQTETIPHDKVMESIELYGKEVIPAFRNGGDGK